MENLKILVCEDNITKANKIVATLNKFFGYGANIKLSNYLQTNLELIEEEDFHIIILDMSMRTELHGNFDSNAGKKTLEALKKQYKHNYKVVLCTSMKDIKDQDFPNLQKDYSIIDYTYAQTDDDILEDKLISIIKEECKKLQINIDNKSYDVAIITALNEEIDPVRKAFSAYEQKIASSNSRDTHEWIDIQLKDDPHVYKATRIEKTNGKYLNVISSSATKMGMTNTAILATKMILKFKPKIIVMLGICAGKRGSVDLGNIIVADRTFDYQAGKVKEEDSKEIFYPDPEVFQLDTTFLNKFSDTKDVWTNDIASVWRELSGTKFKEPDVHIGLVGSGAAVMAKNNTFIEIEKSNRKILAIDMEAYSVFVAAEKTVSKNKPRALVIKSVQDYADTKKDETIGDEQKDEYREYGSFSSAYFFLNACHQYFIDYLEHE